MRSHRGLIYPIIARGVNILGGNRVAANYEIVVETEPVPGPGGFRISSVYDVSRRRGTGRETRRSYLAGSSEFVAVRPPRRGADAGFRMWQT